MSDLDIERCSLESGIHELQKKNVNLDSSNYQTTISELDTAVAKMYFVGF